MHAILATFLLLPSGSPLLTVDDTPGSGAMYATIQAAVDAAPDGATIRIASGTYAAFSVTGKGLALVGDNGALVNVAGTVSVQSLAADQEFMLRRLSIVGVGTQALQIAQAAGRVWIEECEVKTAIPAGQYQHGKTAVELNACADVRVSRSAIQGAHGSSEAFSGSGPAKSGGIGIHAYGSTLRVYDSSVRGGSGGSAVPYGYLNAGQGADAILLDGSRVTAWGTQLYGGHGGYSDYCYCPGQLYCGNPGNGGHCINTLSVPSGIVVELLGATLVPGEGGPNGNWPTCPEGANGQWVQNLLPNQTLVTPGPFRSFYSKSPVDDGAPAALFLEGVPGDLAVIAAGVPSGPFPIGDFVGLLFVAPAGPLVYAGPWSAAALQPFSVTVPQQPPGFESLRVHLQGAVVTSAGQVRLLAPASLVVIDDAL
ncbi:MAG: hypothetical protein EPO68_09370 [Planctomycetota bacterium]|nr:MAG: hypothetical protein EPO68_09370 [Planctomycetota bacterium]